MLDDVLELIVLDEVEGLKEELGEGGWMLGD